MKIKTQDGEMNVTGQNQGTYNTIAGSLGLASFLGMGAQNGCNGNGFLGNLFGGNNNNCCGCPATQKELYYATALAQSQSDRYSEQIARQEAEKAFLESRRVDDKISAVVKETTDNLIKTGVAVAENAKALECLKVEVGRNREEARTYTDNRVSPEAQLRKAADDNLASWVNSELCKKIEGVLRIDGSQICYDPCPCGKESDPFYVSQVKSSAKAQ